VPAVARTWGAWELGSGGAIVAKTCPIVPQPGSTDWNLEWVIRYNASTFQNVLKAFTDDYSDQEVARFGCLFGAKADPDGSCTTSVTSTLEAEFRDVIGMAPNYKVYYHTGICHSEREADGNTSASGSDPSCDWDVTPTSGMVQNGVAFHDWVNAWIKNSPNWINIR